MYNCFCWIYGRGGGMSNTTCKNCEQNGHCRIQMHIDKILEEFKRIVSEFDFTCSEGLCAAKCASTISPCNNCTKPFDACHVRRVFTLMLSDKSAHITEISFTCANLVQESKPQQPKSCLTHGPEFDCNECEAGYNCPEQGIKQMHTHGSDEKNPNIHKFSWESPDKDGVLEIGVPKEKLINGFQCLWPKGEH